MPNISLCTIVKNEETNLPACLAGLAELVHEIIVVDTGSTDRTKELAAGQGARVFDFPWVDSFAAARNESIRHASGDWIFWLDADDRIDEPNRQVLRDLFAGLGDENAGYMMRSLCPATATRGPISGNLVSLFPNRSDLRWRYRAHELIEPAIRESGGTLRETKVVIQHLGYQEDALAGSKEHRNLRLLRLQAADTPDDPYVLFFFGRTLMHLGNLAEAQASLQHAVATMPPGHDMRRQLCLYAALCHNQLDQFAQALKICLESGVHDDAELIYMEAELRHKLGDLAGAESCLLRLLAPGPLVCRDAGVRTFKARSNLAVVYFVQGRLADAEHLWQAVLAEQPRYLPAALALAELYLGQRRWDQLEPLQARLRDVPQARVLRERIKAITGLG